MIEEAPAAAVLAARLQARPGLVAHGPVHDRQQLAERLVGAARGGHLARAARRREARDQPHPLRFPVDDFDRLWVERRTVVRSRKRPQGFPQLDGAVEVCSRHARAPARQPMPREEASECRWGAELILARFDVRSVDECLYDCELAWRGGAMPWLSGKGAHTSER